MFVRRADKSLSDMSIKSSKAVRDRISRFGSHPTPTSLTVLRCVADENAPGPSITEKLEVCKVDGARRPLSYMYEERLTAVPRPFDV